MRYIKLMFPEDPTEDLRPGFFLLSLGDRSLEPSFPTISREIYFFNGDPLSLISNSKTFEGNERLGFRYDYLILVNGVSDGRVYNVSHDRIDFGVVNLFRVFLLDNLVIFFLLG